MDLNGKESTITVTWEDVRDLIQREPIFGEKLLNVALRRTLAETQQALLETQARLEGSPQGEEDSTAGAPTTLGNRSRDHSKVSP